MYTHAHSATRVAGRLPTWGVMDHGRCVVVKELEDMAGSSSSMELEDKLVVSGRTRVWWGALGPFFGKLEGWW